MHHLATLPVFFIAAVLAVIFAAVGQAAFARTSYNAVKKFVDAPFHGFGAAPPARPESDDLPEPNFVPMFVFAGLAALAALTALASGIANLLVFFTHQQTASVPVPMRTRSEVRPRAPPRHSRSPDGGR